jgi:Protein of unknown function (DUF3300)
VPIAFPAYEVQLAIFQTTLVRSHFAQRHCKKPDSMRFFRKLTVAFSACFVVQASAALPAPAAPGPGTQASIQMPTAKPQAEYAPLGSDELDTLVAPIALYPDALVAQVLGASTFPYEIVAATLWVKDNSTLTGESLAKAVDAQSWDPAVKALTQFPSVLDDLAKNLAWTSALGEASATQQSDVMAAVQRMRAKAQAAGNLKTGPEIKVVQEAPQTIVIQPANPQIVYVPVYNPTVIYGAPIIVPGYYYRGVSSVTVVSFGSGVVVSRTVYTGCCVWGWSYWGTNWHSHTVVYNRNVYVGNSYWRGGYYGGTYRPPAYHPGYKPVYPGYRPPSYPAYGRPPATTLPANASNPRPGNSGGNRPSTLPANTANRPTTMPSTPTGNRPNSQPSQRPSTQPARSDSFSGSAGGRAQSARGNQSMAKSGGGALRK